MGGANGDGWRPHMCDMIIYDEEADKHVRIPWEEALAATMVDDAGRLGGMGAPVVNVAGGTNLADWFSCAQDWAQWNVNDNTGNKKTEFDTYRRRPIPYIVVARPFSAPPPRRRARPRAAPAVRARQSRPPALGRLTVAGRDTGATRAILPQTPMRDCC